MICPTCQSTQLRTERTTPTAASVRRVRQCIECKTRFTTFETVDVVLPDNAAKREAVRAEYERTHMSRKALARKFGAPIDTVNNWLRK